MSTKRKKPRGVCGGAGKVWLDLPAEVLVFLWAGGRCSL
jgi:hypothetical protein